MTTIAYRAGMMAADTLCIAGGRRRIAKKLYRAGGMIIGISGNYQDGLTFVRWCKDGCDMSKLPEFIHYGGKDDAPDFNAMVLSAEGCVQWTEHFQPMPILDEFYAMGSGAMAATAAMVMGSSAQEAVELAMKIDANTGGDIEVERI